MQGLKSNNNRLPEGYNEITSTTNGVSKLAGDPPVHGVYCKGVARNFDQRSEEEIKIYVAT